MNLSSATLKTNEPYLVSQAHVRIHVVEVREREAQRSREVSELASTGGSSESLAPSKLYLLSYE